MSRVIAASAPVLYGMVADVGRMGQWSPECRACEWLDGATEAAPGARFRGRNRSGATRWSRTCEVVTADRGREFAFRTVPDRLYRDATVWRYRFEPVDGGTRVTESYAITLAMAPALERFCSWLLPQHVDMRPQMAATLERIAAAVENPTTVPQLRLPGQVDAPAGPVEVSGMYLLHFALRRDLDAFARALPATPLADADTWQRLRRRWVRFDHLLHKHHDVEDACLWPALLTRAIAAGGDAAAATLRAMAAEHEEVHPLSRAVSARLDRVVATSAETDRDALLRDFVAYRERLAAHLAHEERDAMRLVQRYLTQADWAALEEHFEAAYGGREVPFALGWTQYGVSGEGRRHLREKAGRFWPLVVVAGPVFERAERRTFRYGS